MSAATFQDYLDANFASKNSGTIKSYITAIAILDELLAINDVFGLNQTPLSELRNPYLIEKIIDYVADQESLFRAGQPSLFDNGRPNQTSYPRKRFCTAAIRRLGHFINSVCVNEAKEIAKSSITDGRRLSTRLIARYHINDKGTEKERMVKQRVGQDIFRAILLDIYGSKCCLTGLDVPHVLRASHIIPWAEKEETRMNPENGLCLSATYDAAFDKHLITFDEDFRMVLSPVIKEAYDSEAFHEYFVKFEGKQIAMPSRFLPSQQFLQQHREKLIV